MRTWAVITQKGGSGKTTMALHLAVIAQQSGLKTVIVDADPQQSALKWAVIRNQAKPVVVPCVAADLRRLLPRLERDGVDLALIDTSPRASRDTIDIAAHADLIILPARPSILDLPAVEDTLRLIGSSGDLDRVAIVLNAVPPQTDEGDQAAAILGKLGPLLPERIGERVDYRKALTAGRGITEFAPSSRAAKEMMALYAAFERRQKAPS
jgi:chromosome partitioning protein